MSRKARMILILLPTAAVVLVLFALGSFFRVWAPNLPAVEQTTKLETGRKSSMDDALKLIHAARDQFADVKDYSATYLRNEFIDGEMQKNQILLKVRHEPFSVHMEWLAPRKKSGRRAAYIEGKNDNMMRVKEGFFTLSLNPKRSIDMKESRHTIVEAGLKNMIDRFCKRWQEEKKIGRTEVVIQDGEVQVMLPEGERTRPCQVVTTKHNPKDRDLFLFYRTALYFDKETKLPIRMQGYDWPKAADDRDGQLVEDYTYLDLKTNIGLNDNDFRW